MFKNIKIKIISGGLESVKKQFSWMTVKTWKSNRQNHQSSSWCCCWRKTVTYSDDAYQPACKTTKGGFGRQHQDPEDLCQQRQWWADLRNHQISSGEDHQWQQIERDWFDWQHEDHQRQKIDRDWFEGQHEDHQKPIIIPNGLSTGRTLINTVWYYTIPWWLCSFVMWNSNEI